jgi:hypothetical protein
VISNSLGFPASGSTPRLRAAFDHPGTVIVAASGDSGYNNFDALGPATSRTVFLPAGYGTVVAAGGTSLFLTASEQRSSERVWNLDGPQDTFQQLTSGAIRGASAGGCSAGNPAPAWQTDLGDWPSTGCGSDRLVPDISAFANPIPGFDVYDTFRCGLVCLLTQLLPSQDRNWFPVGGTSLSTPIIAAAYALAGGADGVDYPAATLYANQADAYDVTEGGDGWCDGLPAQSCADPNLLGYGQVDCAYTAAGALSNGDLACDAASGFDGASGVGAPTGLGLFEPVGTAQAARTAPPAPPPHEP